MNLHEAPDREATIRYLRTFAVLRDAHRRLGGGGGAPPSVLTAGDGADQAPPRGGDGDGLPDYSRFPSILRAAATDQPPHVVDDGLVPSYDRDDYFEPPYDDEDEEEEDDDDEDEGGRGGPIPEYGEAYRNGGFGGVPAAAVAVANLKKHKYHELVEAGPTSTTPGDDDEAGDSRAVAAAEGCIICIEEFEAGDDLRVMPCSHRFHEGCLVEWLALSRLCPCCRHALPSEDQHL